MTVTLHTQVLVLLLSVPGIFQLKQDSVVEGISAGHGVINFKVNRRLLVQVRHCSRLLR